MRPSLKMNRRDPPRKGEDRAPSGKEILGRPVFERLLFSQYWEDPRMDEEVLRLGPGKVLLSVISGGCNTLSLALLGPSRVIAVDLNEAQIALLELKIAGARACDHGAWLELLGVRPSKRRSTLYDACRPLMTARARGWWDAHGEMIDRGIVRSGRYERYLEAFRRLLVCIEGRRRIARLFEPKTPEGRRRFYDREWDTLAWRLFFRAFFSRAVLGRGGLDPAFFSYVEGIRDFGENFRRRAEHVLVDLPAEENYFLSQICLGRYLDERAMPPYLLEENFGALRASLDRITIVRAELADFLRTQPEESIDAFHLSNVFEWLAPDLFRRTLLEIHRVARPGARLCYRNLLVRRRHPADLDPFFEADDGLAARLLFEDRSFVYSGFEVATVRKPSAITIPAMAVAGE